MALFLPYAYVGWPELTDELHEYVIIKSDNRVITNKVWRSYIY